jgi:hypothetical protein
MHAQAGIFGQSQTEARTGHPRGDYRCLPVDAAGSGTPARHAVVPLHRGQIRSPAQWLWNSE